MQHEELEWEDFEDGIQIAWADHGDLLFRRGDRIFSVITTAEIDALNAHTKARTPCLWRCGGKLRSFHFAELPGETMEGVLTCTHCGQQYLTLTDKKLFPLVTGPLN